MNALTRIRQWVLALLVFGLIGTIVELLLLEHYEAGWQLVPLWLIALALGVVIWHLLRPHAGSVRALHVLMWLFVFGGAVGVGLHFDGAAEFQIELDPSQSRWEIFKKAMHAKAPPVLAPGMMMQLGLLGLTYVYRHPALSASEPAPGERE